MNLEQHHSVTSWFSDKEAPSLSLPSASLSPVTSEIAEDVVRDVMSRFYILSLQCSTLSILVILRWLNPWHGPYTKNDGCLLA